jgi:hypothetical protein
MIKDWHILRKKFTDGVAKLRHEKKSNAPVDATMIVQEKQNSGVLVESLSLMSVVADSPMAVYHTYPSKEIVLIRIAEEANYSGCAVSIGRSDFMRVHAYGRNGSKFVVKVVCSDNFVGGYHNVIPACLQP